MKISCETVQDLLPLYHDHVCSEESRELVEQHLQECEKCKETLDLISAKFYTKSVQTAEDTALKAAAAAWKKGKSKALLKGGLAMLVVIFLLVACYLGIHWFSSADVNNIDALTKQAAKYFDYFDDQNVSIKKIEQRGGFLAALCVDKNNRWFICVFDQDDVFKDRWKANGGAGLEQGKIGSWNFGDRRGGVVIVGGGDISDQVCWYTFQNSGIIYTCSVEENIILEIFITQNQHDINGHPVMLDKEFKEIKN